MTYSPSARLYAIYTVIAVCILIVLNISPVGQDQGYHLFADRRSILGIPHFWNVASNLPFLLVGIVGALGLLTGGPLAYEESLYPAYLIFFSGVAAVGIGSSYYHLFPSNETLLWDRLPMTVAFMAFFTIVVAEYVSVKAAKKMLLPLLIAGVASVVYWHFTEHNGQGDLRFYALVQFVPLVVIPVILTLFPARFSHGKFLWAVLGAYLAAKIFEALDGNVYRLLGISGHTIKHAISAAGPYLFFIAMKKRSKLVSQL
ncbi:MAG: ceramidase domain-containing protein [Gammaproteobacteria bacterium]